MTEPKVVVSAQIEREQREMLERMAAADDRTVSALVRRAVDEFIARERHLSSGSPRRALRSGSPRAISESR